MLDHLAACQRIPPYYSLFVTYLKLISNCNMYVVYLFLYFVYLVSADPDIGDIDGR